MRSRCDGCGKVGKHKPLSEVEDLLERIAPGGEVPAGECVECGALTFKVERVSARERALGIAAVKSINDDSRHRRQKSRNARRRILAMNIWLLTQHAYETNDALLWDRVHHWQKLADRFLVRGWERRYMI